jgi:hypothetical protein
MPCVKGETRYSVAGKIEVAMSFKEFSEGITQGKFVKENHKAFAVLLFYYGVRLTEARRTFKEQFSIQGNLLFFDVGKRLKHGKETDALPIPIDAPFVDLLINAIEKTPNNTKVFQFSNKTGYNIVRRVWHYPHHFRLSRITGFFQDGRPITQVKSWTGLTLDALDYYVGKVSILEMGKSLSKPQ